MKTYIFITFAFFPILLQAQTKEPELKLSLVQAVGLARENSTAALQAATLKETRYWQYRNYKSDYLPQVSLDASLPDFTRNNVAVTQPDGTVEFRPVANDNSQLNLGIKQPLRFSGGQVFMSSNLLRFRDFDRKQTRYSGSPLVIGFNQPLFSFNSFKWDKKIEPLKYEESKKKYTEDLEYISKMASTLFFDLLIAQINHEIAVKNKKNNDTLYKIGEMKAGMGKLSRDELMQLKLASLNAGKALSQADLYVESAMLNFKFYIGNKSDAAIALLLPEKLAKFDIDMSIAISEARKNKHQTVEFRRTLLEAQKEVARAHGDNGLNASLFATFGLSNKANDIPGIYSNPKDQQTLRIGVQVPILDWGRSAARIKTAQANQKLAEYSIAMQENNFDQEIYTQVKQFKLIREQMQNNVAADVTAQERYEIARNRYLLGDLSITDLNIALQEKDQAKRDYIMSLKNFWDAYYNIRVLTLYDFETGNRIGTSD
ncbi:TolC family protein [Pedobacter frigoris]|uniref:TolC family protein n=1 Tax=Pedobacter frigoris TaxID=2571272 RepID=A0A4U1CN80_9SPHI|nr:TolC family protein [Pedobacter frigoris]TKC08696.1 TolC family protein [Pedobacter frigoris]